jgi:hypothetical protein
VSLRLGSAGSNPVQKSASQEICWLHEREATSVESSGGSCRRRGRLYCDQGFVVLWSGFVHLLELEKIGRSVLVVQNRLHKCSLLELLTGALIRRVQVAAIPSSPHPPPTNHARTRRDMPAPCGPGISRWDGNAPGELNCRFLILVSAPARRQTIGDDKGCMAEHARFPPGNKSRDCGRAAPTRALRPNNLPLASLPTSILPRTRATATTTGIACHRP